jgi:hypothetical protein
MILTDRDDMEKGKNKKKRVLYIKLARGGMTKNS